MPFDNLTVEITPAEIEAMLRERVPKEFPGLEVQSISFTVVPQFDIMDRSSGYALTKAVVKLKRAAVVQSSEELFRMAIRPVNPKPPM